MSTSLTNQACLDLSDRLDIASQKIVQSEAKIMNNVIQLDVRRVRLDKIAARHTAFEVELLLRLANQWPTPSVRTEFLRIALTRSDTSRDDGHDGDIRLALRALGEDV